MAINEEVNGPNSVAITGTATGEKSRGVIGKAEGTGVKGEGDATGVWGHGKTWMGVYGYSGSTNGGSGVMGEGDPGPGVIGKSTKWMGVYGETASTTGGAGVWGENKGNGAGTVGKSAEWMGVYGETASTTGGAGVWGEHKSNGTGTVGKSSGGVGVWGVSESHEGVHAETKSPNTAAIGVFNLNPEGKGAAIFAEKKGTQGHAGFFVGDVHVTGNLTTDRDIILSNADCAEDFDIADVELIDPGTVMVVGREGSLHQSHQAYDKRVAGVISGAGDYKPGIVLDKQHSQLNRKPIALFGKVYCKVDAQYGAIEVGNLLTTSPTPGHAMKADDPVKAFGAVIGKALRPLDEGQGLIPILVALQ